jgi:hypothetical protein
VRRLPTFTFAWAAAVACASCSLQPVSLIDAAPGAPAADAAPAEVSVIGPPPDAGAADLGADRHETDAIDADADAGADVSEGASVTTTKSLPPANNCGVPASGSPFPVALDAAGWLYTVVQCDDRLFLFTSPDGGRSISEPILLPTSKPCDGRFALAAGRGGYAYVAYSQSGGGLSLLATTDAGASWSEQLLFDREPDRIRIAAAQDTVVVASTDPLPTSMYFGALGVQSTNGGQTFSYPHIVSDRVPSALAVRPDGNVVWLVDTQPSLLESDDKGAGFTRVGPLGAQADEGIYLFGSKNIYTIAADHLTIADLAGVKVASVTPPTQQPAAATIDDAGVVTIFGSNLGSSQLSAARLDPDGTVSTTMELGPAPNIAGAVALSRHATTLVTLTGTELTFTVTTWP